MTNAQRRPGKPCTWRAGYEPIWVQVRLSLLIRGVQWRLRLHAFGWPLAKIHAHGWLDQKKDPCAPQGTTSFETEYSLLRAGLQPLRVAGETIGREHSTPQSQLQGNLGWGYPAHTWHGSAELIVAATLYYAEHDCRVQDVRRDRETDGTPRAVPGGWTGHSADR